MKIVVLGGISHRLALWNSIGIGLSAMLHLVGLHGWATRYTEQKAIDQAPTKLDKSEKRPTDHRRNDTWKLTNKDKALRDKEL